MLINKSVKQNLIVLCLLGLSQLYWTYNTQSGEPNTKNKQDEIKETEKCPNAREAKIEIDKDPKLRELVNKLKIKDEELFPMIQKIREIISDFLKGMKSPAQRGDKIKEFVKLRDSLNGTMLLTDDDPLVKSGQHIPNVLSNVFWGDDKKPQYDTSEPCFLGLDVGKYPDQVSINGIAYGIGKENPDIMISILKECAKKLPVTAADALIFNGASNGIGETPDLYGSTGGDMPTTKLKIDISSIYELIKAPNPVYRLIVVTDLAYPIAKNDEELLDCYSKYMDETDPVIQRRVFDSVENITGDAAKLLLKKMKDKWKIKEEEEESTE